MASVLFVSKPVEPPWNDSSKNLVRDLATGLESHRAIVMGRRGGPGLVGAETRAVHPPRGRGFVPAFTDQLGVLGLLSIERQADLWHFFFAPNPRTSSAGRVLGRLRRRPSVHTVCSAPHEDVDLKQVLFADRTVVLSAHTERRLRLAGLDPIRIPPCVPTLPAPSMVSRLEARRALQLPVGPPMIVYPGDLEFGRGARTTLEAFARLPEGPILVIACRAKTPNARAAEVELREVALRRAPGRVHFVGETPRIHGLLGAADVVALPSETLYAKMDYPLVLLEAMGLGTPVVTAENTAAAELGPHGAIVVPAHVEPLTRAFERLLSDAAHRRAAVEAGLHAVREHFSPRAMARAYERVYDDLLAAR
ncbi:MAG: glycosyltransferase family 4 protein [Sandaracinus sp.]|nr:glycosyltransferase family 4 protein [Sandaracinus sp.]MCB9615369.1 glycosyltransferase family 4 protein [Sandaracinus sp.]MCB9634961.1 glycosyltransferase family 4 protein [Sandaracinus sp.]